MNSKTAKLTGLFLLIFLTATSHIKAQLFDDWQARPSISLKNDLNNKWSISGTYYQYFDNNISDFDKAVFGGKVNYKFNDWLKAGANYRWGVEKHDNYHDLRYSLLFEPELNLGKWQFGYQTMFQQKLADGQKPGNYLRNLLQVDYQLSPVVRLFALTENYLSIYHGAKHDTQKYALGTEFEITERSSVEFQFTVKERHRHKRYVRLELSYSYEF